jgi:hypothetical protein
LVKFSSAKFICASGGEFSILDTNIHSSRH